MIDKIQKIREKVEKLKSRLIRGACASQIAMETYCKEEAYNEVLAILDSMKEEPVSEDFEIALVSEWKSYNDRGAATVDALEDNTQELAFAKGFYRGVQWHKEQMMAEAVDAVVSQVPCANEIILRNPASVHWSYLPHEMNKLGLEKGDKVKVIVLKEK